MTREPQPPPDRPPPVGGAGRAGRAPVPEDDEEGAIEPLEPASRRPRGPVARRTYSTGSAGLDRKVADLVLSLGTEVPAVQGRDLDLTREIVSSALRLVLQRATRPEIKLVNAALKEFAYAFRVFAPYRGLRKVSIFGSARVVPGDATYVAARAFAAAIVARGWMVITGAGPGIMAAGHEGAGATKSFGVNIRLPFLNPANAFIARDGKLINFKYFFTRKVTFMKESDAFVMLPGGWGTLDETFELLTLVQTGKSDLHPIVLLEPEGVSYWQNWLRFIKEETLTRGFINGSDLALFRIARSPAEAVDEIERFYHNYRSARFVGDRLVLRMERAPSAAQLDRLNVRFADLPYRGKIEVIAATPQEQRDGDVLELRRVALYPRHEYGRIRNLIDALNEL